MRQRVDAVHNATGISADDRVMRARARLEPLHQLLHGHGGQRGDGAQAQGPQALQKGPNRGGLQLAVDVGLHKTTRADMHSYASAGAEARSHRAAASDGEDGGGWPAPTAKPKGVRPAGSAEGVSGGGE